MERSHLWGVSGLILLTSGQDVTFLWRPLWAEDEIRLSFPLQCSFCFPAHLSNLAYGWPAGSHPDVRFHKIKSIIVFSKNGGYIMPRMESHLVLLSTSPSTAIFQMDLPNSESSGTLLPISNCLSQYLASSFCLKPAKCYTKAVVCARTCPHLNYFYSNHLCFQK